MFCNKCGKQLPASASFCNGCGNTLRRSSAPGQVIMQPPPPSATPYHYTPRPAKSSKTYVWQRIVFMIITVMTIIVISFANAANPFSALSLAHDWYLVYLLLLPTVWATFLAFFVTAANKSAGMIFASIAMGLVSILHVIYVLAVQIVRWLWLTRDGYHAESAMHQTYLQLLELNTISTAVAVIIVPAIIILCIVNMTLKG